ncbi:MAG: hypothetical protein KDJ26_06355 [Alphaproteobacteria bacterium]|nr:hypothetical protein [Alphaproteobacteria bacterium]MCB1551604.1 hypothetical protein [Alphaproteobacteria bacterium]MCB9985810.1 hypothetical protein [Micavibrio sp.]HPQ50048.1 hypothetical protein [Alphaproteobacteria bacterium]
MWNRIDPLIQSISRKVEQTDSRMEIRRDESESYGGRKKSGNHEDAQPIPWEDTTIVTTAALSNFLSALLGGAKISLPPQDGENSDIPEEGQAPEHHEPTNTYLSRATSAYQATGRAVHDQNIEEPPPITQDRHGDEAMVTLGSDFGEEELERIKDFIGDLDNLERNGIREISLLRSLNFLDSIEQGIKDASSAI